MLFTPRELLSKKEFFLVVASLCCELPLVASQVAICRTTKRSATTSLFEPAELRLHMIASNSGQDGGIVCEKVLDGKANNGYNALTDTYEDLVKAGVIDPTKVTRTALANASSVATLLLTSDALIAEKPKEGKAQRRARRRLRHVLMSNGARLRKLKTASVSEAVFSFDFCYPHVLPKECAAIFI